MGIQVFVNIDSRSLDTARARSVFDTRNIGFKELVVGDSEVFELFLIGDESRFDPAAHDIQTYGVRMGIGGLNTKPSAGSFDFGAQTAIPFDVDAAGLDAAITAEVAACEVVQLSDFVFKVTFDSPGAQTIPTIDATGLSPSSTISVIRTVDGDGTTPEEWQVRLFANPITINSTWDNFDLSSYNGKSLTNPMKGIRGALNLGTAGVYALLGNSSSAATTVEIELTDIDGRIQTVLQMPVKLSGEVIGQGVTGVAEFDSYLQTSDIGVSVQQQSPILDATTASFTTAQETKLAGIEDAATADQTGAEIKTAYEAEADTNAFTDAEKAKLAAVDASATDDQTGAEIKTAYEAEADTNAFTDAEKAKLTGIEDAADVTDEANVVSALDGATLTDIGTPEAIDRIVIQDASDSNNLKYASFSEFGGGGGTGTGDMLASTYDPNNVTGNAFDMDNMTSGTTNKLYTATEQTKLAGIDAGAEANTIDSIVSGEPTGSDQVLNVVSLTQAEYDAGTPLATTLYIIT
jgi:hypothetical protein